MSCNFTALSIKLSHARGRWTLLERALITAVVMETSRPSRPESRCGLDNMSAGEGQPSEAAVTQLQYGPTFYDTVGVCNVNLTTFYFLFLINTPTVKNEDIRVTCRPREDTRTLNNLLLKIE